MSLQNCKLSSKYQKFIYDLNVIHPRMINTDVFRNFIKDLVYFNFVKENVLTLFGSDFSESFTQR